MPEEAKKLFEKSEQTKDEHKIPQFEKIMQVQFIVTTKGTYATEKANTWIIENWDTICHDGEYAPKIIPFMSYAGNEGMQVGCMIQYYIETAKLN